MTNDELITECAMKVKPELWGEQSRMPYKGVNVLYTEYMRRRAELINEPDDADATDTPAKYTAQDANGEWWWYNTTPYIIEEHAVWDSDGWQMLAARGKVPAGHDWRTTLGEVTPMTTTPNAPTWPRHPAHKAQLTPATSRLTDSQARQFAEECGTCSDGTQCGTFAETAYCDDCPNQPKVLTCQQMIDRCNATLAFWPVDAESANQIMPVDYPWRWQKDDDGHVALMNLHSLSCVAESDWCAGEDLSEPQCIHYGGECGEIGYCAPCPNRPQPEYNPNDVAFTSGPINPSHYRSGKVECIDALESATINKRGIEAVCTANAIKYLWRYESKGGLEDVRKARWYLDRLAQHLGD